MKLAAGLLLSALAWADCAQCHREQAAKFKHTAMASALQLVASCDILKQHPKLTFKEGPYTSEIVRDNDRSILTVSNGTDAVSVPLLYAFGLGQAGQTYVFERNGAFYESRASFFKAIQSLDFTMGARGSKPASLEEAIGRRMDKGDTKACFGCHTHGSEREPGVGCESCHGPVGTHPATKMKNLSAISTEDMSNLCGTCHRTWSQIALNGPQGVNNVRFQPYRITNSKCYDAADSRIRCTACHEPHADPVSGTKFYDSKCTACHSAAAHGKLCKVAKNNCVSCHMPKVEIPGVHTTFTDHQIRIARAGEPYPN